VKPPERHLAGAWLDNATGLKNAALAGGHLLLPGHGEHTPTLEIFTYADPRACPPIMANYTGFTHIAFEVADVAAKLHCALDYGAELLELLHTSFRKSDHLLQKLRAELV